MAVDVGLTLTAKNLYSFVRNVKPPGAGELRDPITFYRSHRLPVKDPQTGLYTDDMEADVTPYHDAWAKVWQAQEAMLNGQNTQNMVSHVFLIRNSPDFKPETRDGIVWQGAIHLIRGTRNIQNDPLNRWVLVLAEQEGQFREEPRKDTSRPDDPLDEYARDDGDPLWR